MSKLTQVSCEPKPPVSVDSQMSKVSMILKRLPGRTRDEINSMVVALNAIDKAYDNQETKIETAVKAI